jgi:hypothetical protein
MVAPLTTAQQIAELGQLVNRLQTADRACRVFGSDRHRYSFGPALAPARVKAFESAHRVNLPPDYRCFLTTIGNGGAGPYYGLEPLGTFDRDLSRPFPFTQGTEPLTELGQKSCSDEFPGILEFCHQGCASYSYLVVAGAAYGTIWNGRPEDDDFRPTGLSFAAWYRQWAERALRLLENERLVPLLRLGMTEADVLTEVGGDWKKRQALSGAVWYFESTDNPAQIELDERGIVIKATPWPFILP